MIIKILWKICSSFEFINVVDTKINDALDLFYIDTQGIYKEICQPHGKCFSMKLARKKLATFKKSTVSKIKLINDRPLK